jgi:ParB family transcriptional regulator, chromosome partitioning protein
MDKIKRKMGLGKGLGAILADKPVALDNKEANLPSSNILLEQIEVNPFQPRTYFDDNALQELKESIISHGIIQPVALRKIGENRYQLISGERRFQASKLANLKEIPAHIIDATDQQMLELGIIENIQRENLNPVEIAESFQRLISECNLKQEDLAIKVGKDRTTINNYLRLLNLPDFVLNGLKIKELSMGHARALLGLKDKSKVKKIYNEIITKDLSVRKVEEWVNRSNQSKETESGKSNIKGSPTKVSLNDYEERFSSFFGKATKVYAKANNKGEILIPFQSKEDLEEIISKLKN